MLIIEYDRPLIKIFMQFDNQLWKILNFLMSLEKIKFLQGSNLTFELNSQMASTFSGFTSHKRVSTSLGTSVQHKIK